MTEDQTRRIWQLEDENYKLKMDLEGLTAENSMLKKELEELYLEKEKEDESYIH